jgi:hypothetical protein
MMTRMKDGRALRTERLKKTSGKLEFDDCVTMHDMNR